MTLGETRVRTKFNPSAKSEVDQIKQKTAELIDLCEDIHMQNYGYGEITRHIRLAQTAFEEGAMWAVKAATTEKSNG